jgi:hypothetical protein
MPDTIRQAFHRSLARQCSAGKIVVNFRPKDLSLMMSEHRRFPPPRSVNELDACVVRDHNAASHRLGRRERGRVSLH